MKKISIFKTEIFVFSLHHFTFPFYFAAILLGFRFGQIFFLAFIFPFLFSYLWGGKGNGDV
ncbi:MAG: hypothetical protein DRZ79_04650 [Candidatus Cloacimonadota bacterium]|nr:MAG: hypothetical protein DRZ79_04650 [Candidatus Cloacimonadota bacterium]